MDFEIETYTESKATQVVRVWASGWHEAHSDIVPRELCERRTLESFRQRLHENAANTRIAVSGGNAVGLCITRKNELYQMYVSPDARGKGVAQALLRDAETCLRQSGETAVWLACAVGNERARSFYEKSGWTNMGPRTLELDTSKGPFPLRVWQFEKHLGSFLGS